VTEGRTPTLADAWATSQRRYEWPDVIYLIAHAGEERPLSVEEYRRRDASGRPIRPLTFAELVGSSYLEPDDYRAWHDELVGLTAQGSFTWPDYAPTGCYRTTPEQGR
jgi:hypothetical protein